MKITDFFKNRKKVKEQETFDERSLSLPEKVLNGINNLKEIFKIREKISSDEFLTELANFLYILENHISGETTVMERIKDPLSIIEKFFSDPEKYGIDQLSIKDLFASTIIVENNSDIDSLITFLNDNFSFLANKNSKNREKEGGWVNDLRDWFTSAYLKVLKEQGIQPKGSKYEEGQHYKIEDGYRNVIAHMVLCGIPMEIQIKTREQYIAHGATHCIYKSSDIKSKDEAVEMSAKLFPYFEAKAYLALNSDKMSDEEKSKTLRDIKQIYDRNKAFYLKYPEAFDQACDAFSCHVFLMKNYNELMSKSTLSNTIFDKRVVETELERILASYKEELRVMNPNKSFFEVSEMARNLVCNLQLDDFKKELNEINNMHPKDNCSLVVAFDSRSDVISVVDRISELGKSFKYVNIEVYSDELIKIIKGEDPNFDEIERAETVKNFKGVGNVKIVDLEDIYFKVLSQQGKIDEGSKEITSNQIAQIPIVLNLDKDPNRPKKPVLRYIETSGLNPGVETLSFEIINYIARASQGCEKLFVGVPDDSHLKEEITSKEIAKVLTSIQGVEGYHINEILPPEHFLALMEKFIASGERCQFIRGPHFEGGAEAEIEYRQKIQEKFPSLENVIFIDSGNIFSGVSQGENGDSSEIVIKNEGERGKVEVDRVISGAENIGVDTAENENLDNTIPDDLKGRNDASYPIELHIY